jgi:hypothetical protein
MRLGPEMAAWVLDQGLPAVIEIQGGSMSPALRVGERVKVEPAPLLPGKDDSIEVGDIVLVITRDASTFLLHRVMYVFAEAERPYVVHQGDAALSHFAICPRDRVVGKAVGFEDDGARAWPTVARMSAAARNVFRARMATAAGYCLLRGLARDLRLKDRKVVRGTARLYRKLTAAIGR